MAEHPNVQRIRDTYAAFAAGDLTTALKNLAPAGVFHFRGSGPLGGRRMGVDNIKTTLVGAHVLTAGTRRFDIASIYADDHHGVVVMRETATRPDGATLDLDEVHLIAFDRQGRITDLWDVPSDPEAHNRFFDGA
jgi:ketosteroid isomerase-like protein